MLKQIQDALRQVDFDAVLITSPQNRRYATGIPSSAPGMSYSAARSASNALILSKIF